MKKLFTLLVAALVAFNMLAADVYYSDFTQGQQGWSTRGETSVDGVAIWQQTSSYGMKATAYVNGARHDVEESLLVSPAFSLENCNSSDPVKLTFIQAMRYGDKSQLSVRASVNNGQTWTTLSVSSWPDGSNWNFVTSEADLSAFIGQSNVRVAFVYSSTTTQASTWEIKSAAISIRKKCGSNLYWTIEDGTLTVLGTGDMYNHSGNSYYPWSGLSFNAVVIQDGVTSIGNYAFQGCTGLTSVTIGNSVTRIGISAFDNCTNLPSVTLPNSVTNIGGNAFSHCSSFTSVSIPSSVNSIGNNAFFMCTNMTSVTINSDSIMRNNNSSYDYLSGAFGSQVQEYIIGNGVTTIGEDAFRKCYALRSVTISNSVTTIGAHAFDHCTGLTSVTMPNSVTSIGDWAFSYCTGLTSLPIGNGVTNIGEFAYVDCTGLTSINIPNSVTSLGMGCFEECTGVTSVTIPNSVTTMDNAAFAECSGLTTVTIPNSVTSMGSYAFRNCTGLSSVTLSNNLTSIEYGVFLGCSSLESVTIPDGVTSIESYAFYNCSGLISVTIPAGVTSLGDNAFCGCSSLSSVSLPDSLTVIKGFAFYACPITTLTIPGNVQEIYAGAFAQCVNLVSVTCEGENPPRYWNLCGMIVNNTPIFDGVDCSQIPLYVHRKSISDYENSSTWGVFNPILPIEGDPELYTIRFVDYDGTELQVLTDVEEGTIPEYTGALPTRLDDEQYTYTFSGWSPEIVEATEDATYTATYEATPISQGVENILTIDTTPQKKFVDGQILILRGEKVYTLQGQEVR